MNFKPELCALVLEGKKTVTRRPVNGKDCTYTVGRDYAVCPGRGKKALGRMRVLDVSYELIMQITDDDARLEGFADRAEFVACWTRLYGRWDPLVPVWRIQFELQEASQ